MFSSWQVKSTYELSAITIIIVVVMTTMMMESFEMREG